MNIPDLANTRSSGLCAENDVPLLAVHFDSVFRGREVNAAFIWGVFQISESFTQVKSGDRYGELEISSVSSNGIDMSNRNSLSLSPGNTVDLVGNLKIIVADSSTLRFALSVERTGAFEMRGTIYPTATEWDLMNFGLNIGGTNLGFYYDMDNDVGKERLKIESINGRTIPEGKLRYSTTAEEVSFDYPKFGTYQIMGNISFRVANSDDVIFYPSVYVTPDMISSQLLIDAPLKATAGEVIKVKVTAGGIPVEDAFISINSDMGQTGIDGLLNLTLKKTMKGGTYNMTATKLGYEKTSKELVVLGYVENRLSIDAPAKGNQLGNITIRVLNKDEPVAGAAVSFDNKDIGLTDENDELNYMLEDSGMHTIYASMSGFAKAARDIEVRMPFAEFVLGQKKTVEVKDAPFNVFLMED